MSSKKKQSPAKAPESKSVGLAHNWLSPIDAASPCGPDLEYDPEFVVLSAQLAAKRDAQYGDFVGVPEPVNWSEVDRDCRRLMMRSKDMRLALLFTRCRTRLAAAAGLAEGLGLLAAWLTTFPNTVHPQPGVDDDQDAALEIRMNALQALTDTDGLLSDVREIALVRSTATRLQVRDVERAFAHPRPNDALAPESVMRQLDDMREQQPETLTGFDNALASLATIDAWSSEHLGVYAPDLSVLTRLLRRIAGDEMRPALEQKTTSGKPGTVDVPDTLEKSAVMPDQTAKPLATPARTHSGAAASGRHDALEHIREARHWFEQHEPSSPIPVLLRRAEQFVGRCYAEVVKAIPAELLEQWESEA